MRDLFNTFKTVLNEMLGPDSGRKVIAGVSGGPDSMALADLLQRTNRLGAVAHLNYHLRSESDGEEALVRAWCVQNGVPIYVLQADPEAMQGESVQLWARKLRYAFFEDCMAQSSLDYCALGHQRDDQVETVLFRLLKSRNLNPLAGMPSVREPFFRPLLGFSKQQLLDYCVVRGIMFAEDASNNSPSYIRNRIRHEVLPELTKLNPDVSGRLLEASADLSGVFRWMDTKFRAYGKTCLSKQPEGDYFLPGLLHALDPDLNPVLFLQWWLGNLGLEGAEIRRAMDDFDAQTGARWLFGDGELWREVNGWLWIPKGHQGAGLNLRIELTGPGEMELDGWRISVWEEEWEVGAKGFSPACLHLDAQKVRWPLLIRNAMGGDFMVPIGLKSPRDVKELVRDARKAGEIVCRNPLVLVDSKGMIVGMQGGRACEFLKLNSDTRSCLKVSLEWIGTS